MSAPLLYRPPPRWHVCVALAASIAIHAVAAATARTKVPSPEPIPPATDLVVEDTIESPTEPPEQIEIPLPPPPPPVDDVVIPQERTTIVPKPKVATSIKPIARPTNAASSRVTSVGAAKIAAISAPRPDYPYEARRQHATGSGIAIVTVEPTTGQVTNVTMQQSTGNAILDNATISAFRRWRFKPGSVSVVRTPITFTLTGVEY